MVVRDLSPWNLPLQPAISWFEDAEESFSPLVFISTIVQDLLLDVGTILVPYRVVAARWIQRKNIIYSTMVDDVLVLSDDEFVAANIVVRRHQVGTSEKLRKNPDSLLVHKLIISNKYDIIALLFFA